MASSLALNRKTELLNMCTTSDPESLLGLAMCRRRELKVYQYGWIGRKAEFAEILTLYVQPNRFANIGSKFVKRVSLRHDRYAYSLCDIATIAFGDLKLDDAFHARQYNIAKLKKHLREGARRRGAPSRRCFLSFAMLYW